MRNGANRELKASWENFSSAEKQDARFFLQRSMPRDVRGTGDLQRVWFTDYQILEPVRSG
jgi:hypothetical protein